MRGHKWKYPFSIKNITSWHFYSNFSTPAIFFEEMEPMFVIHNISIATDDDIIQFGDDVNIYPVYLSKAIIMWGNCLNWLEKTIVSDYIFCQFLVSWFGNSIMATECSSWTSGRIGTRFAWILHWVNFGDLALISKFTMERNWWNLSVCGGGHLFFSENNTSLLSNSNCWQIIDMYMPAHKILLLIASGSNKGSDEPAHQHRAFAAPMHKTWIWRQGPTRFRPV